MHLDLSLAERIKNSMVTLEDISLTCKHILSKKTITSGELIFLLDGRRKGLVDFALIDIREPSEHKNLSISGTDVLFPVSKMHLYPEVLEELRHENFVMYCTVESRSIHLVNLMKKMGFAQITQLKGGIVSYHGKTARNVSPPNIF